MRSLGLLVVTPAETFPVELPLGRPVVVGTGTDAFIRLTDAKVAAKHLVLTAREEGVAMEELRGTSGVFLNDVQLASAAVALSGDEISLGASRLVVTGLSASAQTTRPRLAENDELLARLHDEALRSARQGFGWVMVGLPPLNAAAKAALVRRLIEETGTLAPGSSWGSFSPDVLGAVVPRSAERALSDCLARLPSVAGPRAKVVSVVAPADGRDAERLLEKALDQLLPTKSRAEGEWVLADPVMVRLNTALESTWQRGAPVALMGANGVGRERLLRRVASLEGEGEAVVIDAHDARAVQNAAAPTVILRDVESLPTETLSDVLQELAKNSIRVGAIASAPLPRRLFPHQLKVPLLWERRSEILPLADSFLSLFRVQLHRPRLWLSTEAQALLSKYTWPGNVRELKNVIHRAARSALRDEIGQDALPLPLTRELGAQSVRGALTAAERELVLEALARTRWNVSAAAVRLGLPRRTLVYRMARLGLKRPSR
ncbi:MAG: FHA domain-containing protein [Myxococcaceae bacterium]|nr:FHA domain-containing protein [Myxococcaceae bacterium]